MRQKTLLKIIGLMRTNLDRGLTILEISKKLKIGYRPAYNHITEMEKEGIVHVEKVGSSKQCKLNLASPHARHLLESLDLEKKEEICKKNPKLKAIFENLISKLTERYPSDIISVVLFGSYAKGTATKQSDVDLMFVVTDIKSKPLRESIEGECASYQISYNIKISPLITNIEELKNMLRSKDLNAGKETREFGISLYGHEMFWRIII